MILETIAAATRLRVAEAKAALPLREIQQQACALPLREGLPFEQALAANDIAFICEVKKASPSKGVLTQEFPYVQIAKDYEKAGAVAISVLTEPMFFQGSNAYLTEIRRQVSLPLLRKDFIVEEYQIYETKLLGADAVLLIVALLEQSIVKQYLQLCAKLGLSALVEVHDEQELETALSAGARIIGVNNRNLKSFEVDLSVSLRLRPLVPQNILFVAESGIQNAAHVARLKQAGVNAVLIGESLIKSKDKAAKLAELRRQG